MPSSKRPIYLDANATIPQRPSARAAAQQVLTSGAANPSSVHGPGRAARRIIEDAREALAALVGARPREMVFTSGGTEANNAAVHGTLATSRPVGAVVASGGEHPSVRAAVEACGRELCLLPLTADGVCEPASVDQVGAEDVRFASVMLVNNETGVIFDVAEIAKRCRARWPDVVIHTDAVQALGKLPLDVASLGVDMMSVSSHKVGGPQGVGALFIREGLEVAPLLAGGAQEHYRRGGTQNVAGIAGFAAACSELAVLQQRETAQTARLRGRFEAGIRERMTGTTLVGARVPRVCNTATVLFDGCEGETLLMALDLAGVAVSTGSACSAGSLAPSPVLLAMGLEERVAGSALRFSLTPQTTESDIDEALDRLVPVVARSRSAQLAK